MADKTPSIVVDEELLREMDDAAEVFDLSRSQAFRDAARLWLSVKRQEIASRRRVVQAVAS